MKPGSGLLGGAIAFYVVWTAATWLFEGRIATLLRPEAMGDRIAYAYIVNLLFGVAGGIAILRYWQQAISRCAVARIRRRAALPVDAG